MDSTIKKSKKGRRKVVNIRCRKISSNSSQLSFSRVASSGYKRQVKSLSKNNKDLAYALQDARCDLENSKKDLNNMKFARIKMLKMHIDLKTFMKGFEEALILLDTDDTIRPLRLSRRGAKKNMTVIEPVEEVTETESMILEQLDVEENVSASAVTLDSAVSDEPNNSTALHQTPEVFNTPIVQPKDGTMLANKNLEKDFASIGAVEDDEDRTPTLVLPSPIIIKLVPDSTRNVHSCLDVQDNVLPLPVKIPDIITETPVTTYPVKAKGTKIPRIFGLNKTKKGSSVYNIPSRENKHQKLISENTNYVAKFSKSNLPQKMTFLKNTESLASSSKLADNCDMHDKLMNKNIAPETASVNNQKTLVSSLKSLDNCDELSYEKEVSTENELQGPVEAPCRRKTFVISGLKNLEPRTEEHNDRRKTYFKKSSEIDACTSIKNKRGTFTVSQYKDSIDEESTHQSENSNVHIISRIENAVQNALCANTRTAEAFSHPRQDSMAETTVIMEADNLCNDIECIESTFEQNIILDSNTKSGTSVGAERAICTEVFDNGARCTADVNIIAAENLCQESEICNRDTLVVKSTKVNKTELNKVIENFEDLQRVRCTADENIIAAESLCQESEICNRDNLGEKSTKVNKTELNKVIENVEDLQNKNQNDTSFIIKKKATNTEEPDFETATKNLKELRIEIQRDDTLNVEKKSQTNKESGLNKVTKNLEVLHDASHEILKVKKKSMKVRKSGLNRVSQNSKDFEYKIQSEDNNIQILDNPKKKDSCSARRRKRISYIDFISSSDSDIESIPDIEDIIEEVSTIKTTPVRRRISKSKNKKVFVFKANKRKSLVNKYVRKSAVSSKLQDGNVVQSNGDKCNIAAENLPGSSTNLTENLKKPRKSVTFAVDAKKVEKNVSHVDTCKKSRMSIKEFQMPAITEDNEDITETYKKQISDEIKDKDSYRPKHDTVTCKENVYPKETNSFDSCQNKGNTDPIFVENSTCCSNAESSEIDDSQKSGLKHSKTVEKIRKRKGEVDEDHVDEPKKIKKNILKKKTKEKKSNKDMISSDNEIMKDDCTEDAIENRLSKIEVKKTEVKKVKQSGIPVENTFVVCAEVHAQPPSPKTKIPLKKKKKLQRPQRNLSIVLNDVFDSECIDLLNISGDKETFLKGRTSFPLKVPLSDNSNNTVSKVEDNPKDTNPSTDLNDCGEGLKSRRGKKIVSYREPSSREKLRR